jgi:ATP-dependent exoDNAse (exonuclease V) alpha subunit
MVQRVAEGGPINARHMISEQLRQLNTMTVPGIADADAINLRGDQYDCYTAITQNISASRHQGRCFFITGPGGTGKSYLLRSIQHWCDASRQPCVLLAPTGIAARNIDGNTIHSGLSIYSERGSYHTGLFQFAEEIRETGRSKKKTVLIIDEVSMVDAKLLDYISTTLARLKENHQPFGNMHVIVFGDLMQLPPVDGQKVFKANIWKLFHPFFLEDPQRQTDLRFFNILNKVRFGIIDEEVRAVLTERWQQFDPRQGLWNTTYLSSLREEADALNQVVLSSLQPENPIYISEAEDFENGERIDTSESSRVFKRGTNFPSTVTCVVGAKVMFLTNSMLADKGISNGSIGIITEVLDNENVKAAFPTKDGIQVCLLRYTFSLQCTPRSVLLTREVGRSWNFTKPHRIVIFKSLLQS